MADGLTSIDKSEESEILGSARGLIIRKNKGTQEWEYLLLENAVDSSRNSIYELPGGKFFENLEEFRNFTSSIKHTKLKNREAIAKEVREEVGQYYDFMPEQFHYLGLVKTTLKKRDNKWYQLKKPRDPSAPDKKPSVDPDSPEFKKQEISFYVVVQEDFGAPVEAGNSDDDHVPGGEIWQPLRELSKDFRDKHDGSTILDKNSDIFEVPDYKRRISAIIRRIENKDLLKTVQKILNGEKVLSPINGRAITIKDIAHPELLPRRARIKIFEESFGSIKEIQTRSDFKWATRKAINFRENHQDGVIPEDLKEIFKIQINSADLISKFMDAFDNPDIIDECRLLFNIAQAYIHSRKAAPWFADRELLDQLSDEFKQEFENNFLTGKKQYYAGKKRLASASIRNSKTEERIIDKLLTKAELDFTLVKDVLGFELVVNDVNDIRSVLSYVQKKYPNSKRKAETSNANRSKDYDSSTVWLSLEYQGIPAEIRIIAANNKKSLSAEDNYHPFYVLIKNKGERDSRLLKPITDEQLKKQVRELAKNPYVQDELNLSLPQQKVGKRLVKGYFESPRLLEKASKMLLERWETACFKHGKYWISYQHTLRLWKSPLSPENFQYRSSMFTALNKKIAPLTYTDQEWEDFFENTEAFLEKVQKDQTEADELLSLLRMASNIPSFSLPTKFKKLLEDIDRMENKQLPIKGL